MIIELSVAFLMGVLVVPVIWAIRDAWEKHKHRTVTSEDLHLGLEADRALLAREAGTMSINEARAHHGIVKTGEDAKVYKSLFGPEDWVERNEHAFLREIYPGEEGYVKPVSLHVPPNNIIESPNDFATCWDGSTTGHIVVRRDVIIQHDITENIRILQKHIMAIAKEEGRGPVSWWTEQYDGTGDLTVFWEAR